MRLLSRRRLYLFRSSREAEARLREAVAFSGETLYTGVCHMAFFTDPDGNDLMLHHRYAPRG